MRYKVVNLLILLDEIGEQRTKDLLSSFTCPLSQDVEYFLQKKSIDFARQGWAQTHLIFTSFKGSPALVGYFTLASKVITVPGKNISKTVKKRISNFSTYDNAIEAYCLSAPLIAQLGKNFSNSYNKLITGNELLSIACDKVSSVQFDLGGRFAYLECEDIPALIEFYKSNGFFEFDKRNLDSDEVEMHTGSYLVQLLKRIK